MKNILLVAIVMLGMISCEKDYSFPVANTTWENHEWHKTVVEFKTTEVIISVFDKDTDELLIVNNGTYVQNVNNIQISFDEILVVDIHARLDVAGYLIMHLGTNSETKYFQK